MPKPPLLSFKSVQAYQKYYKRTYCGREINTHDGIRVYFKPSRFDHAFFEHGQFAWARAQRMDWIEATLKCRRSECYQGWDRRTKRYVANRRVNVAFDYFVVILEFLLRGNGLKGNFVTCYPAHAKTQRMISRSPWWDRDECLAFLRRRKGGER